MLVDRLYYELNLDTRTSEQGLSRMYSGMTNVLSTVAKWAGLAAGVYAVGKAINAAKNEFLEFETGMREVWTLVDASEESIRSYTGALLEISLRVPQQIGVLEKAMYQAISSNVEMGDSLYVVERSAEAAVAGLTDVKTAVDITTTVMNAYGLTIRDVTDINDTLFTGVREGKTTYDELASSLGVIIPAAATLGVDLDTLVSALAAMTRGGIDTTNAVTYLNQVLMSVLSPTKEATDEAAKYGIELSQTALQTKGLLPFLEELKDKTGDNSESMAKMFGNVRALRGVLSLTGSQMSDFNEIMGEMENKSGATESAFAKMVDSTENKLEALSSTWIAVGVLIWEKVNPAFRAMIDVLAWLGKGIISIIDDSYKLRDMFQGLDSSAEDVAISIREVAKEVEAAKSALQTYLSELERVKNEADGFQNSIDELTSLVYEHNFAVSTGEGDYNRLREAIEKLVDQNPELIGMYEMEGEMIKLNTELMKAQTKVRIADLEMKKEQLQFQVEEQQRAIKDAQTRLDSLTVQYRRRQDELADLQELRDAISEYYSQISEIRTLGVFGDEAKAESERLLTFLGKYGKQLIEQNILTESNLELIYKEVDAVRKLITMEEAGLISPEQTADRIVNLFRLLPVQVLENFDDEVNKLNKSLNDTGTEIESIQDNMTTFENLRNSAGRAVDATGDLIGSLTEIKDTIGTGMEDYWAKWLSNERIVFDRYINDYKALKDSESEYDKEMAERSLQSAYSTAQKIRLYAIRQGDEQAKAWAASELDALSEIQKGAEETYESIVESRKKSYDKRIQEEKNLIMDLEKDLVGSENKILLDRLEAARKNLARSFVDAYFATGDESYLARIEKETAYSLDQVLNMTEKAEDTLERLYQQRDESIERYNRAIAAGQVDDQITLANQLANTWKEIFYNTEESSDAANEAFKAWKMWESRALVLSGELERIAEEINSLQILYADYMEKGRLEDAMKAAQQLSSYAKSQYEYTVEIGKANEYLLLLSDQYAKKAADLSEQIKGTPSEFGEDTKTSIEKFYDDLEAKESAYYAIYSQYRAAMTRGDIEHANLFEEVLNEKQNEILSLISSVYRETGNYNVFKLLGEKAKEFGITTEQVFNLVQEKKEDQITWEEEQQKKINKLLEEYNALLAKGASDEATSKLKQFANANLEMWLYTVTAGKEQSKYYDEYKNAIDSLIVEEEKVATTMDKITNRARAYYQTVKLEGEEAAGASRELANEIARMYKEMYYNSIEAGQANETYWNAYIFWSKKGVKETVESKNKVKEYIEEIDKLVKLYDDAVAQGTLNVALDIAQSIESLYSRLSEVSSNFFTEQEEWIKETAELREKLRTPTEPGLDPVAKLQLDLSKERELLEQANEEKIRLERELQEERERLQEEEAMTPEDIEATPSILNLQAELEQALSIVEGREKAIAMIYQKLWEETKDPTWLREWVAATKKIEENTISTWENLKLRFEVMVADSKALSESALSQWELMRELMGDLPETGRISFLKDLFSADDKTAMDILNYVTKIENTANQEILKGLDSLIKAEEEKSRERIQQAKGTIEQILDFEHMNYQQKINYLTMFGNVFKGSKEEELQVAEMIEKEKNDLEKELYEERKRAVIEEKEAEIEARLEAAEKEISEIANAERIGITYRIRYLQNWMQFYEGTAEERIQLEQKVTEEILKLQGSLDTELENRAKNIPAQIAYKERLDILKNLMQEELEAARDNLEAQLEIEEKYQELKEEMREDEIENIKNFTSENLDLLSEMAGEMVDALAEGGAGAGIKFLEAMFEGIEGIAQHYMNIYVVEPLLDEIAQATAEFEEQGMSFFDALMQGIAAAVSGDWVRATLSAIMLLWNLFKKFGDDILDFFENILPGKASKWLRTIRYEWGGGLQEDVESLKEDLASAFEADTYEGFVENFRRTLQGRIKDAVINAFLESAMMKPVFEKLAKAVHEAFADSEFTDEEWAEIKQLMDQTTENAKEAFERFQELFGEIEPEQRTNIVKSITEETANVLLAIERSSNLYLREINENIRAMRFLMQGWSFNTPVNVGFETQQTLRSHGL